MNRKALLVAFGVMSAPAMVPACGSEGVVRPVPVTLAANQCTPTWIAVDADAVYWTNRGSDGGSADGTVMKVGLHGGSPATLASNQLAPRAIAVDAQAVYWLNSGSRNGTDDGTVMKVGLSGGTPITLARLSQPGQCDS